MAREVKKYNIAVNVICPDRVVTDMARNLVFGEGFNKLTFTNPKIIFVAYG